MDPKVVASADRRRLGPEWTERFYETADRYGLTILDDWSKELQARYGIRL